MGLAAKEQGLRSFVVPATSAPEAAVVDGIDIIPVGSLTEAVGFYSGRLEIPPQPFSSTEAVAVSVVSVM